MERQRLAVVSFDQGSRPGRRPAEQGCLLEGR